MRSGLIALYVLVVFSSPTVVCAQTEAADTSRGDQLATEYFAEQTKLLTAATLADVQTLDDWTSRRDEYHSQLLEMLGLDPFPERTPLEPVVTGITEEEGIVVQRVHFQSMPGLYVTGNLYLPAEQNEPLPAILYVCGHGAKRKNGISFGNKTHYQHHGAWFARNGYVCLTIDTIQLGEIEGIHHGTYREKMWWWNNRGYTPAGVEAWNCVRSLDYLQSRDEVDGERLGVTGRSGGGAYSWWIAAIDERIKVAVPVAGITSLKNHVVDGCVEGHCDCMYMVNTYRWDYPLVAALVAPRPLLISNTDKDRIFPLDGVVDVHAKVRRIYDLYDAADKLGLQITEGPHKDTQELRVHAFRWFNRFLKQDDSLIETTATPFFEPEQLKVFDRLPEDERVTTIHESFVPAVSAEELPTEKDELQRLAKAWIGSLREHCFRGWPHETSALNVKVAAEVGDGEGVRVRAIDYTTQSPYRLQMYLVEHAAGDRVPLSVFVLDQPQWEELAPALAVPLADHFPHVTPDAQKWKEFEASSELSNTAFVIPRGVGPTQWSTEEPKRTHIRRRFMQLGQTAATMQIYDILRALTALDEVPGLSWSKLNVKASGEAATWTVYASLFDDKIDSLVLQELPTRNRDAPDLLNVSRFVEIPHVVLMAADRVEQVTLSSPWEEVFGNHPYMGTRIRVR